MDTQPEPVPDPIARHTAATARCGAMGHHGRCVLTQAHDATIAHLYATPATPVHAEQPVVDTLPAWLYQRFGYAVHGADRPAWADLPDAERGFWADEAAAVRRAVGDRS